MVGEHLPVKGLEINPELFPSSVLRREIQVSFS